MENSKATQSLNFLKGFWVNTTKNGIFTHTATWTAEDNKVASKIYAKIDQPDYSMLFRLCQSGNLAMALQW